MELMCKALSHNKSAGEQRVDGLKELGELSVVDANGDINLPAFNTDFNSHLVGFEANDLGPDGKSLSPSDAKAMYVDSLARGAQADPAMGETHKVVLQAMREAERKGETLTVQELQAIAQDHYDLVSATTGKLKPRSKPANKPKSKERPSDEMSFLGKQQQQGWRNKSGKGTKGRPNSGYPGKGSGKFNGNKHRGDSDGYRSDKGGYKSDGNRSDRSGSSFKPHHKRPSSSNSRGRGRRSSSDSDSDKSSSKSKSKGNVMLSTANAVALRKAQEDVEKARRKDWSDEQAQTYLLEAFSNRLEEGQSKEASKATKQHRRHRDPRGAAEESDDDSSASSSSWGR